MLSNDRHYIDHVIISRLKFCVLKWRRLRSNRIYIYTVILYYKHISFERQFLKWASVELINIWKALLHAERETAS